MKFKVGDKVRIKSIKSDSYPDVYYAKIVSFPSLNGDGMAEVYWYSSEDSKSYSHTHFYPIGDLIRFGRNGHHLTNIFK